MRGGFDREIVVDRRHVLLLTCDSRGAILARLTVDKAVQLNGPLEHLDIDLACLGHGIPDQGRLYFCRGDGVVNLLTGRFLRARGRAGNHRQ